MTKDEVVDWIVNWYRHNRRLYPITAYCDIHGCPQCPFAYDTYCHGLINAMIVDRLVTLEEEKE